MAKVIILIAVGVLMLIALVVLFKYLMFKRYLLNNFKSCNVGVEGKKGRGKGLLFQWVINHRKETYYSNVSYSKKGDKRFKEIKSLREVSCEPNYYENIVNDKIEKQPHKFYEGKDIYIDDIGVFLPSYMDSTLYKKFPSMPILYALSRHLYDSNIHFNTQNIERGWKALREQADFYISVKGTIKLFGFIFITKMITYEKYESCKQHLMPLKSRILNKFSKAQKDLYDAKNGLIRKGWIINYKWNLHYDTRIFEKKLLKGRRKVVKGK